MILVRCIQEFDDYLGQPTTPGNQCVKRKIDDEWEVTVERANYLVGRRLVANVGSNLHKEEKTANEELPKATTKTSIKKHGKTTKKEDKK